MICLYNHRICVNCGISYLESYTFKDGHRFCSPECRHQYKLKYSSKSHSELMIIRQPKDKKYNPFRKERICENCGVVFTAVMSRQKYCGRECCAKVYENRIIEYPKKANCLECGKEFFQLQKRNKYCSYECATKLHYFKSTPLEIRKKNCAECGTGFVPYPKNKIYCSRECQYAAQLKKISRDRFVIFERDNFTCIYCGRNRFEHGAILQADHIIPRSRGGLDIAANLVTSCSDCNASKSNKVMELQEKLLAIVAERNEQNKLFNALIINGSIDSGI